MSRGREWDRPAYLASLSPGLSLWPVCSIRSKLIAKQIVRQHQISSVLQKISQGQNGLSVSTVPRFLYVKTSSFDPTVGAVEIVSPKVHLYKSVVLPALSRPRMQMRSSSWPNSLAHSELKEMPIGCFEQQ